MEEKELPSFAEVIRPRLEHGIVDPSGVMALLKLPDAENALKGVERLEIDLSSKKRTEAGVTELVATLRVKYGYGLDAERATKALFHLSRGLNLHPRRAVAHYWPQPSPVVFLLGAETALIVAPKI